MSIINKLPSAPLEMLQVLYFPKSLGINAVMLSVRKGL
jgi:hypothetical protein